ncbi:MAG TPA: hypothetical protein VJ602_11565 [Paludibacter sp.]|nr:hypothetical protein [Paludibacter sp.]
MNIKSDFEKDNTPAVSNVIQHYIFAFVQDSINQPDNIERGKKWLKDYCENENLNYSELEYNLNVFFDLLEEYRKTGAHVLYHFLRLQAQYCFIGEERFGLLRINPTGHDFLAEIQDSSACSYEEDGITSSHGSGIVGGHIIDL